LYDGARLTERTEKIEVRVPPAAKEEWETLFHEAAGRKRVKNRGDFVVDVLRVYRAALSGREGGERPLFPNR